MGMNIFKALRRIGIPVLALGAFFASCTEELSSEVVPGSGGGKTGESEVTLKLQVPKAIAGNRTRAVDTDVENTVDDLYILAFKVDGGVETFEYCVQAKRQSPQSADKVSTWTADLKVRDYKQTFVMIANAQGTENKVNEQIKKFAETSVGMRKMTVLKTLTEKLSLNETTNGFNATADGNHRPFTMFGQTEPTTINLNNNPTLTVNLHRIMARVHVEFTGRAATGTIFEANRVLLYNFNDLARVIPDDLDETTAGKYVTSVTIPESGVTRYPVTLTDQVPAYEVDKQSKKVHHSIYMFEVQQPPTDANDSYHYERPCLIVEGKYAGEADYSYYRLDFAETDQAGGVTYKDIVRNHSYNITVKDVMGPGSKSVSDAISGKAANILADMEVGNDNAVGNIEIEGDKMLGIATKEYELMKAGGKKLLQQVLATDNVEWNAELFNVNIDGEVSTTIPDDWIYFTDEPGNANSGRTLTQTGINALQNVYFNVDYNDKTPERKAIMRFTAGNLILEATVVQNQDESPLEVKVDCNGKEDVDEIKFLQGSNEFSAYIAFGPSNAKLRWKIVSDPASGGINITNTMIDNASPSPGADGWNELQYKGKSDPYKLDVTAEAIPAEVPYATRKAMLYLYVENPNDPEQAPLTREIPILQKKYGLEIDKTTIYCAGQEVRIYVKGNCSWEAWFDQDASTAAVDAGLIPSSGYKWKGVPSEASWTSASCISFKAGAQPLDDTQYTARLSFRSTEGDNISIDPINIGVKGGLLAIGNQFYEVFGPVQKCINEIGTVYDPNNAEMNKGATMMNQTQASALQSAVRNLTWGICSDSKLNKTIGIYQGDTQQLTLPWGSSYKEPTSMANGSAYAVQERIVISPTGAEKPYGMVDKQDLLSVEYAHSSNNTAITVQMKPASNENMTFDIVGLGTWLQNQWGVSYYNPKYGDFSWKTILGGDPANGLPAVVHKPGNTGEYVTIMRPDVNDIDTNAGKNDIKVTRKYPTVPLVIDNYKGENYKFNTYYFREIKLPD
jgi:hypothetical protein